MSETDVHGPCISPGYVHYSLSLLRAGGWIAGWLFHLCILRGSFHVLFVVFLYGCPCAPTTMRLSFFHVCSHHDAFSRHAGGSHSLLELASGQASLRLADPFEALGEDVRVCGRQVGVGYGCGQGERRSSKRFNFLPTLCAAMSQIIAWIWIWIWIRLASVLRCKG